MGNFNTHVGRLACGKPEERLQAKVEHGFPWYQVQYFNRCQWGVCVCGRSIEHFCNKYGYIVMNGHCCADAVGVAMFVGLCEESVLDLVLVPANDVANMSAVDNECD